MCVVCYHLCKNEKMNRHFQKHIHMKISGKTARKQRSEIAYEEETEGN